jgi:acylphosphatase
MAIEVILRGEVQGVFCRKYCGDYAREMGLHGAASNRWDGTVQVILATDHRELAARYISSLKRNSSGYRFYGHIYDTSISLHSGDVRGDYTF